MWRPKDWKEKNEYYLEIDDEVFEAGADAMLEALRNSPNRRIIKNHWVEIPKESDGSLIHVGNGTLVFIPDDKEEVLTQEKYQELSDRTAPQ